MPIIYSGIPAMKPRVERYKQEYVTAIKKIKEFSKQNLLRYEKAARSWRDLQGKPGDPYPSEMDMFHIAIYQAVNTMIATKYPGTVAPWFSRFYQIQYAVKSERERVYIESNPAGARIWIDEVDTYRSTPNLVYVARDKGDASRKVFLLGRHRLKLRKAGFQDFIIDIQIGPGHGRDNPYKFALARPPAERIVEQPIRATIPEPRVPVQAQPPPQQRIYTPTPYPSRARTLPSLPPVTRLPPPTITAPAARQMPLPPPSMAPAYAPSMAPPYAPSMAPAYAMRARRPLTPPPLPPPFMAGAKTSNTAFTLDGIREPFSPPPLALGNLAQIKRSVTMPYYQSRLKRMTARAIQETAPARRLYYRGRRAPARDPWITDTLIRQYAADVNKRGRAAADAPLVKEQADLLYEYARRRGYIEFEMATRHGWLAQRHKSPYVKYLAPYSAPMVELPKPVPEPRAIQPSRMPPYRPQVGTPQIKIVRGRYYKKQNGSWLRVRDIKGRPMIPQPAKYRVGYGVAKAAREAAAARKAVSFRKRAEQVRAARMRK